MNKRSVGSVWEERACRFLEKHGIRIIDRNFKRYRGGEIDIVGRDTEGVWIVTEVKYRTAAGAGSAAQAVGERKIFNICRAFDLYRVYRRIGDDEPVRFDVIAFEGEDQVNWIRNAFDYRGLN